MKLPPIQTKSVHVDLGPRSYSVLIGAELLKSAGALLREHRMGGVNAFVLTNSTVGDLYFQRLHDALMLAGFTRVVKHEMPTTEEGKSWDELSRALS